MNDKHIIKNGDTIVGQADACAISHENSLWYLFRALAEDGEIVIKKLYEM